MATAVSSTTASKDKVPLQIKLGYGFGSVAYGIKDNGFAFFLLFYYNQVLGLDATLVGTALVLALFADACFDPVVGHLSDNTKSRLGKRHPWLYAASVPIAAAWLLLWHPPEMSDSLTFAYLLSTAIAVRFTLSMYEVPSLALLPNLTADPHERTSIMRYRFLFGWSSGLTLLALAFGYFLANTPQYPDGQLNPSGYSSYAILGAGLMLLATLVSAIATHRPIIDDYNSDERLRRTNSGVGEIWQSFSYRPFARLLLVSFFAYANQGVIFALTLYMFRYLWELPESAFLIYSLCLFFGVVLAFVIVSPISRRIGKPKAASWLVIFSIAIGTAPYWLRAVELFPENGSAFLIPLLFVLAITGIGLGIASAILGMSMMADISSMYEADTGKKSEGIFSAGMWFMQKLVGGIGLFLAGAVIALAGLPEGAAPGTVAPAIVSNFNLLYVSLVTLLGLITAWAFRQIPLVVHDAKADTHDIAGEQLARDPV